MIFGLLGYIYLSMIKENLATKKNMNHIRIFVQRLYKVFNQMFFSNIYETYHLNSIQCSFGSRKFKEFKGTKHVTFFNQLLSQVDEPWNADPVKKKKTPPSFDTPEKKELPQEQVAT